MANITGKKGLNEDEFKKLKLLQSANVPIATAAKVSGWSTATVSYVFRSDTLVEYSNILANNYQRKVKPAKKIVKKAEPDQLMTVLNNIASELSTINERLERLEEAHETKFSFFKH